MLLLVEAAMGDWLRKFFDGFYVLCDLSTDGTSNTVLLVEVNPEMAVDWTKPQGYKCDHNNPLRGLGESQLSGFNAALVDGSVRFISNNIDPEIWKNLTQMNDGNVIQGF